MFSVEFVISSLILILLYYCVPVLRKYLLLLISIGFYFSMGIPQFAIIFLLVIISFLLVKSIGKSHKRRMLLIGIVFSLFPLVMFKYWGFLMSIFGNPFSKEGIFSGILSASAPIGISFLSFKVISTLVDTYKGRLVPNFSFIEYAIYIFFLPTVFSGPIDRADLFIPQINTSKELSYSNFSNAFFQILFGLCMKTIIADKLAVIVNYVYCSPEKYRGIPLFITTVLYSVEIYADFCGYTFIALGFAKILGFKCLDNFKQPYIAENIKDFWSRWHISLSTWLRDYIYIPLGGNRKGNCRKYLNILITF